MRKSLPFELVFTYRWHITLSGWFQKISHCLYSQQYDYDVSGCEFLWVYPVWSSFNFSSLSLAKLGKFSAIIFLRYFFWYHTLLSASEYSVTWMLDLFWVTHGSLRPCSFLDLFVSFLLFRLNQFYSSLRSLTVSSQICSLALVGHLLFQFLYFSVQKFSFSSL